MGYEYFILSALPAIYISFMSYFSRGTEEMELKLNSYPYDEDLYNSEYYYLENRSAWDYRERFLDLETQKRILQNSIFELEAECTEEASTLELGVFFGYLGILFICDVPLLWKFLSIAISVLLIFFLSVIEDLFTKEKTINHKTIYIEQSIDLPELKKEYDIDRLYLEFETLRLQNYIDVATRYSNALYFKSKNLRIMRTTRKICFYLLWLVFCWLGADSRIINGRY